MNKTKKVAVTAKASPKSMTAYDRLQRINKWLAWSYALQALLVLLLATGKVFPVTVAFLGVDSLASQSNGAAVYAAASKHLFDMPLAQLLGLSLGISAAFHVLQAFYIRPAYEELLDKAENPYRWLENAFSASLLPVAIGLAVGVRDIMSLIMVLVLGFVTHLLGWQFEHHLAAKRADDAKRSFTLLAITSLTTWLVLGFYVLADVVFGNGVVVFAGLAYVVGLAGVLGIGWVLLQHKRQVGRWQDYVLVEKASILLSFVTKSAVAWLLLLAVY